MSAQSPKSPSARSPLLSIQYLRGIAALFVAYFHCFGQIPRLTPYFDRYLLGSWNFASGVDIFFVISGFIMLVTSEKASPLGFLFRRVIRIVPLYWIFTLLLSAIFLYEPDLFRTTSFSPTFLVKSLLFVPYANPGHGGEVKPLLVPGWSLNFEMFFYLVFSLLLLFGSRYRVRLSGAVFALLVAIHFLVPAGKMGDALEFLTDAKIFEFWFGMLIGRLYLKHSLRVPHALLPPLLLLGFFVLLARPVGPHDPQMLILLGTMVPAAVIIFAAVSYEQNVGLRRSGWLLLMGDASYSMYLSHVFALGLGRALWAKFGLGEASLVGAAGFGSFAMALVVLTAVIVYFGVEKPMTAALHRWQQHRHDERRRVAAPSQASATQAEP